MEMKLGTHACYFNDNFVSMTTTLFEQHQIASSTLHSSNLIANGSTHGDETWYACVLHHFHDDNEELLIFSIFNFYMGLAPFHRDIHSSI